jgi:hypothetical protein
MNENRVDTNAYPLGPSEPVNTNAYPIGGSSAPIDSAATAAPSTPTPNGNLLNVYTGATTPPPGVALPPTAPQAPMKNYLSMAASGMGAAGSEAPMPQQTYPKQNGVGQNGFGIHPDTTREELADYLMNKIEAVESSGDPTNYPGKTKHLPYGAGDSKASGLFQYLPETWGGHGGYARAMDAPPEIQRQKMKQDLITSLTRFGNDPYKTVAFHYRQVNAHDPTSWDKPTPVKYKSGRTPETVSEYVYKILQAGNDKAGGRLHKYLQGVNSRRQVSND